MSGIKYLLDTNIIIGMYQHSQAVIDLFQNKEAIIAECAYSNITRMELLGFPGITELEAQAINNLLSMMQCFNLNQSIEDAAIAIKQQYLVKLPDAIIAATASTYHLELLTLDKKLARKV